jgi:hypothetical protein
MESTVWLPEHLSKNKRMHAEMEQIQLAYERPCKLIRSLFQIRTALLVILFLYLHGWGFVTHDTDSRSRGEVLIAPRSKNTCCYVNNICVGTGVIRVTNLKPGRYRITGSNNSRRQDKTITVIAGATTRVELNVNRPSFLLSLGPSGVFSGDIILVGATMDLGFEFPWGYIGLNGGSPFPALWMKPAKTETYTTKETYTARSEVVKEVPSGSQWGLLFGFGIVAQQSKSFVHDNVQLRYGLLLGFWGMDRNSEKDIVHVDGSVTSGSSFEYEFHRLWGGPCVNLTIGGGVPALSFGTKLLIGYAEHSIEHWRGTTATERFLSVLPAVDIHLSLRFGRNRSFIAPE